MKHLYKTNNLMYSNQFTMIKVQVIKDTSHIKNILKREEGDHPCKNKNFGKKSRIIKSHRNVEKLPRKCLQNIIVKKIWVFLNTLIVETVLITKGTLIQRIGAMRKYYTDCSMN